MRADVQDCVLALDLGTTAFKAAAVHEDAICGKPTIVRYALDYADGCVTCPPKRYLNAAFKALRGAATTARAFGLHVRAVGICSQAQTFLALDERGNPLANAVVWTDDRAVAEAKDAADALPNFARTSGFARPSPLQFLPKVKQWKQQSAEANRFLLLNEWLLAELTGVAYGDETNQGMGGFWDIERRAWSAEALHWAGVTPQPLAWVRPAATHSVRLKHDISNRLNLPVVPVYSCGNDQSVAAVGAGLEQAGDVLCNFGTAMVVYALRTQPVVPANDAQIAGIHPRGDWFLLGLESECGNVLDWLARLLFPKRGVAKMIDAALNPNVTTDNLLQISRIGGGSVDLSHVPVGSTPEHIARAALEFYAERFAAILDGVRESNGKPCRLFASGGLSQSDAWLDFLSQRIGLSFVRTSTEHPSLLGIARIIDACRNPAMSSAQTAAE